MNKFKPFRLLSLLVGLILAPMALGDGLNQANTAWIMTSTALVLFMTIPGLSLFYAGLVFSATFIFLQFFTIKPTVFFQCFFVFFAFSQKDFH